MIGTPLVVTALGLLLGSIEPASQPRAPEPPRVARVPVLMYHVVGEPPPGAAWPQLYVSAAEFADQVEWLAENGYQAVTLTDVWDNWRGAAALPPRPVVLTFDDGHRSVRTSALPLLSRLGWPAVLNLKVGNLEPGSFTEGACAGSSPPAGSSVRTRSRIPTSGRSTPPRSSTRWRARAPRSSAASALG